MPSFSTHVVTGIISQRDGLQRVELDSGRRAYVLTGLVGPVVTGDRVVVNTTAVDRQLGTGGWDVVHWNLTRDSWEAPGPGHVMKLRYTSLQTDTGVAEEVDDYEGSTKETLEGVPVVACGLHSQVGCVAAAYAELAPGRRLAYVMTDAGALPLPLSDLVAALRRAELLAGVVTAGQSFGGDYEAVNVRSALDVARSALDADAIVVGTGPGVVGTATALGLSSLEVASIVDFAGKAGATPVVPLRYSGADPRPRHQGVSHHSEIALSYAHERAVVPVPRGRPRPHLPDHDVQEVDVPDMAAVFARWGLVVTTMGRNVHEDPLFFAYAGAGGAAAAQRTKA